MGLVLNLDKLGKPLRDIRDHMVDLPNIEEEITFALPKRQGNCSETCFPANAFITTKPLESAIEKIDMEWGKPGVNVAGLLKVTSKEVNVTNML